VRVHHQVVAETRATSLPKGLDNATRLVYSVSSIGVRLVGVHGDRVAAVAGLGSCA
jgi:hypothetical protein